MVEVTKKHLTWGAVVAAAAGVSVLLTFWDDIGGPVPLTKNSPVIKQVKMDIDIQELQIDTTKAKVRALEMDSLTRAMESDEFLKSQYNGRANLTAGDRQQIARLETKIKSARARWDKLLEAE